MQAEQQSQIANRKSQIKMTPRFFQRFPFGLSAFYTKSERRVNSVGVRFFVS
jgi:hypothetical protein